MALTIGVIMMLALLGLVGLWRGVRGGLAALAGTLLAAVLVDLWQERWAEWLRETVRPERPALPTFLLTAAIFLGVTLMIGYGGSLLLPRPAANARPPGLPDRLLGGLVGVLNGALLVSYLLRYAAQQYPGGEVAALVSSSWLAGVLDAWLPWFILALVGVTGLFVLLRGTMRLSRALGSRPAPTVAAAQPPAQKPAQPQQQQQPAEQAAPRTRAEMDQRVLSKIREKS